MEYLPQLILPAALCAVLGYLLGSLNSSIMLTKIFSGRNTDIREHGSGNAGMTNVLRTVGKKAAVLTFIGDFIKCVVSVFAAYLIMSAAAEAAGAPAESEKLGEYAAGIACVLGHIFPLYFGFRGGKGVVTSAAMILILDWRVFLLVIATFLIVFLAKKIISLASVISAVFYPVYTFAVMYFIDYENSPLGSGGTLGLGYVWLGIGASIFIGGLVIFMHRANIGRLMRGEEKRITGK